MKKIVVLPGGFHPFHAGHLALYQQALSKFPDADVYMAASDNQKERPFPFKVKQLLATEVAGIPKNKFVQVGGSPFNPDIITKNYNSSEDALIFVRSEKDRKEHPLPDQIRKKDGKMGYLLSYPGKDERLKPFADHGYIDYLPVAEFSGGMTSATEIRNAWPKLDELGKIELIKGMYPGAEMTVPKVKKISQILDSVLMGELVESFVSPEQLDEGLKEKLAVGILALGLQFSKTNADEVYVYQNTQGKYVTAYSKEDVPNTSDLVYYVDTETDKDGNDTISEKKWLRFPASFAASDAKWFLKFLPTPKPEYLQKAIDELRADGLISESFVDPDQSKQYWNHDAQKVGVGMMIDMPLTDKPNLNGRRQGFNEGEERSIIRDAAIDALVNAFEGHADEAEIEYDDEGEYKSHGRDVIEANIYNELSRLNIEDIVDPEMLHHGQRMGNFASGRVIDVVDSGSVIDEVLQQLNYFDTDDARNYVSEGLGKMVRKAGSKFLDYLAGSIFNKDFGGEKPRIDVFKHNPLVTGSRQVVLTFKNGYGISILPEYEFVPGSGIQQRIIRGRYEVLQLQKAGPKATPKATEGVQLKNGDLYISSGENMRRLDDAQLYKAIIDTVMRLPIQNDPVVINATESMNKIRNMIKESTDEQKSKSVHLHRRLFELMEEEKKNNVVKLRGFGREADKRIPDINKVRAEKEREQERENNRYSERRAEQEELLARLQAELLNAKQEFSELADAQLLPIEMLDTMENINKLIDFIENWEGSEEQNNFPFTESILEKLHLKTVKLKEYFGGTRDRSAPKVLRQQTPRLSPKAFWNTIDLSETADYIEEK